VTVGSPVRLGRALLSVYDPSGLVDLARALAPFSVELFATTGYSNVQIDAQPKKGWICCTGTKA
jgi:AICAR transformylase/IMP cyclohydrolase PurH